MRPTELDALRGELDGDVVTRGEAEYDASRTPAVARYRNAEPEAVVRACSAGDVAKAVRFARARDLHLTPRSGGHCFAGGSSLGQLGRTYGLTCDALRRARVVLADGSEVVADEAQYADLFWALRGAGGGQVGVVTELVFATVPDP